MRLVSILLLSLAAPAAHAVAPLVLYDDAFQSGFTSDSWANVADFNLANTSPTFTGSADSIRFVARGWGGLQFINNTEFNLLDYQSVTFHVNGGASGGQKLQMYVCDNYNALGAPSAVSSLIPGGGGIPQNAWATATLDFDSAGLTVGTFNCFVIMDADGNNDILNGQPAAYIDQIVFNPRTTAPPGGGTVNVSVNLTSNVHAFSPLIFGVAFGDAARNQQMGYTVDRWGGNSVTRYNWQVDTDNKASDYLFFNEPEGTGVGLPANSTADQFVSGAINAGAQPLITIPTINWTPRDRAQRPGFSIAKYGPQHNNECTINPFPGCNADAGDGTCDTTSNTTGHCNGGVITGNDPADTSIAAPPSFEQSWIAHLQSVFGNAAGGGVKFYSLDNEVMLWDSTHRDVHPSPATYDEIWNKTLAYATAIKAQDANALVTGPVTWGYPDLFTSAADAASCNCLQDSDRNSHGGLPFVAWYLQQVCANPLPGGKRLVDYVDLHFYPQFDPGGTTGIIYSNNDDAHTRDRRLRSLKELYDASWQSESWIGTLDGAAGDDPTWHYTKPNLIPRVKAWINQYCPGTKLAITEYAWDQDQTGDGAVAQAEALAIFAREGVDMATRWTAPATNSKAERGFSIFLNYDGAGAKVSGDSVAATSANVDQIGAYAFHGNQRTMVLLTNKDTVTHDVALTFDSTHNGTWKLYGFSGTSALAQTGTGSIGDATLTLSALPPISASLLVISDVDEIFKDGFGG